MTYLLDKKTNISEIVYMDYDTDGYTFNPKYTNLERFVEVKSITVFQKEMINSLLVKKFEKKFSRLSQIIMRYILADDDETDEGDFIIMLDEVARLKALVENKYKRFLENEEYRTYMDELYFLDVQLQNKLAIKEYNQEFDYEVKQGRGR